MNRRDSHDADPGTCPTCGTHNARDSAQCVECGQSLPITQPAPAIGRRLPLLLRLLVSLVVAGLVLGICTQVAYRQFCSSAIRYAPLLTLRDIGRVRDAIEEYRRQHRRLPRRLSDFPQVTGRVDKTGWPLDWWGRGRFHYWTDGTRYRISSYGRDGKPGGLGLDYDLSSDDLANDDPSRAAGGLPALPREAEPTFWQFATDLQYGRTHGSGAMMLAASILAGAAAFFLAFRGARETRPAVGSVAALVLNLIVIMGGALLVGTFMAAFHAPSGH